MAEKFWMVWVQGADGPTKQHGAKQEAKQEAERLALLHPGCPVWLLESEGFARAREPVQWDWCWQSNQQEA